MDNRDYSDGFHAILVLISNSKEDFNWCVIYVYTEHVIRLNSFNHLPIILHWLFPSVNLYLAHQSIFSLPISPVLL